MNSDLKCFLSTYVRNFDKPASRQKIFKMPITKTEKINEERPEKFKKDI